MLRYRKLLLALAIMMATPGVVFGAGYGHQIVAI